MFYSNFVVYYKSVFNYKIININLHVQCSKSLKIVYKIYRFYIYIIYKYKMIYLLLSNTIIHLSFGVAEVNLSVK